MDLLGLKLIEISDEEVQEVTDMISKRDQLRAERKYKESDEIRNYTFRKVFC